MMKIGNSSKIAKKDAYTTKEKRVIARERIFIRDYFKDNTRGPFNRKKLGGLALSGGGVRSASFAFGVMQALAATKADGIAIQNKVPPSEVKKHPSILQRLHYLSTVSGGGFAGTALTRLMKDKDGIFDLSEKFPLRRSDGPQDNSLAQPPIDVIRHQASYLDANSGPAKLNVIGVVARTVFLTFSIYLLGLAAIVGFLHPLFLEPQIALNGYLGIQAIVTANPMLLIAGGFGLLLLLLWFLYSLLSGVGGGKYLSIKSRQEFEEAGGWIAFLALIAVTFGVLGQLPRFEQLASEIGMKTVLGAIVGLGSLGAFFSRFEGMFGGISDKRWSSTILIWSSGIILIGLMLVASREMALFWTDSETQRYQLPSLGYWLWIVTLALLFFVFGAVANVNFVGLHRFYRDRLMRTFLTDEVKNTAHEDENSDTAKVGTSDSGEYQRPSARTTVAAAAVEPKRSCDQIADEAELNDFCVNPQGLYHLINANVVLVNSDKPKFRGRGGDSYILSPLYTGSQATGWVCTSAPPPDPLDDTAQRTALTGGMLELLRRSAVGRISLASAMAVSGAALNPSAGSDGNGPTRSGMLPLMLSLLGIRLGYWQPNPKRYTTKSRIGLPNFIRPGLTYGILQLGHRENSDWIELTDGGHFENMGLYELFRRKVKVIIAADGSTDPDLSLSSFASAYERARNDFGVEIDIASYPANFNDMTPDSARPNSPIKRRYKLAEHGFAIGVITYKGDPEPGYIFYVNTVLTENLRPNLYSYRAEHPEFPDEPVTDQFFNEKQFDAYCQLGYELTEQMISYTRGWKELSGALGIKPSGNAKPWEKIADTEYFTAEELLTRGFIGVSGAIGKLAGDSTLERMASAFRKPQRKG